jgi:hypothetical protein
MAFLRLPYDACIALDNEICLQSGSSGKPECNRTSLPTWLQTLCLRVWFSQQWPSSLCCHTRLPCLSSTGYVRYVGLLIIFYL